MERPSTYAPEVRERESGNCGGPTTSCGRRPRIPPKRSSTADRSDGRLRGRAARNAWGRVICRQVPIAPSTSWRVKAQQTDPTRRSARAQRDEALKAEIDRVWHEQEAVYGADKVWRQLRLESLTPGRYTVARPMKDLGLRGVVCGQRAVITTWPDPAAVVPDLVDRQFTANRPNQLWASDFTYVPTAEGSVYTAFVIDVFSRRIVGWKVSTVMRTSFVLDALEQAIHQRGAGC